MAVFVLAHPYRSLHPPSISLRTKTRSPTLLDGDAGCLLMPILTAPLPALAQSPRTQHIHLADIARCHFHRFELCQPRFVYNWHTIRLSLWKDRPAWSYRKGLVVRGNDESFSGGGLGGYPHKGNENTSNHGDHCFACYERLEEPTSAQNRSEEHQHRRHHHRHHQEELEHHGGHLHSHHDQKLNLLQLAIVRASNSMGFSALADAWRDNLRICCVSLGLLLLAVFAPHILPKRLATSIQSALVVIAFPLTGVPAFLDAAVDIAGGKVNIHVLMTLAAFASMFLGNVLEGALLLAMFSLSHQAEEYFTHRALGDVKALKENNPEFALVVDPFDVSAPPPLSAMTYKRVAVADVEVGSYLLIKAGEMVPVDGEVWQGRSTITLEHLTGEAHPVEKQIGAGVPGGAINLDGLMIMKATKSWHDSTLSKIMKLTEEAQLNRPKLQRWLDEFGEYYSRIVVLTSIAVVVLGPLLFKWPFMNYAGTRGSVYRALGLMVAASPCALAVAPLAYATAISACANKGILLKGGQALDALTVCKTVAFDKTGTLTTGKLVCKAIEPIYGHLSQGFKNSSVLCCTPTCEMKALAIAAAMEKGATHPIARALVEHSEGKQLPMIVIDNFESAPGKGLTAVVTGPKGESLPYKALLGSLEYITTASESALDAQKINEAAEASSYGRDMMRAALFADQKVTLFHFEDKVRPGADEVLRSLNRQAGLQIMMLTGDHFDSAKRVAEAVGIEVVFSGLKPEDKLQKVKKLAWQKEKGDRNGLIMVGDGINDAPALAAATVGIVLGQRASATAVAVADVLLIRDAIDGVPFVISKAHQTASLVKQNVVLALISIIVAALSSVLGVLPLWMTVLLHEGGTLLVCANSARALNMPQSNKPLFQSSRGSSRRLLCASRDLIKRISTSFQNRITAPVSSS